MDDREKAMARDGSAALDPAQNPEILDSERLASAIEAVLLTSDKPISLLRLAEGLGITAPADPPTLRDDQPRQRKKGRDGADLELDPTGSSAIEHAIGSLNAVYQQTGRAFRIEKVAGGYRLMTLTQFAPVLAAFHHARTSSRLSRAAVETLAIIAYRQPITRAHLEAIRGVGCGEVLRSLMERRLVTIKGRAEELGRPMLYGTTKEFLDAFGLASLKDLPNASDLQTG